MLMKKIIRALFCVLAVSLALWIPGIAAAEDAADQSQAQKPTICGVAAELHTPVGRTNRHSHSAAHLRSCSVSRSGSRPSIGSRQGHR